jgi:hypothetical protein
MCNPIRLISRSHTSYIYMITIIIIVIHHYYECCDINGHISETYISQISFFFFFRQSILNWNIYQFFWFLIADTYVFKRPYELVDHIT